MPTYASSQGVACFNSRTREGCDCHAPRHARASHCFNSRTREGCDILRGDLQGLKLLVSIHAPGRGATITDISPTLGDIRFNSRTREGCD